jgi:hypothetical protein
LTAAVIFDLVDAVEDDDVMVVVTWEPVLEG